MSLKRTHKFSAIILQQPSNEDMNFITGNEHMRILPTKWHGQKAWIKRYGNKKYPLIKLLHSKISFLLFKTYLKSAPIRSPNQLAQQEMRKMQAFARAGMPVTNILAAAGSVIVTSDVGLSVQERLSIFKKQDNIKAHDELLIKTAKALGCAHSKGLVHGRPFPRDMFLKNGEVGFLDFEEEPEAIMSIEMAQARDAWLLFFQITSQAFDKKQTSKIAFELWRKQVSQETIAKLRTIIQFFSIFIPPLRFARLIWLGGDGQRMLSATEFLHSHLKVNNERSSTIRK